MAEALRRVTGGFPRSPDPLLEQALDEGDAAFDRGELPAAHASYVVAQRRDANDARVLSRLGLTLTLVARDELKGTAFCEEAIRRGSEDPDALWRLARVYLATHSRERAVRAILRGLELSPTHPGHQELLHSVGIRRPPVLPFLPRGNVLNKVLGKLRHRLAPPSWAGEA